MQWSCKQTNGAHVSAISRTLGLSKATAILLAKLGVTTTREAEEFLNPALRKLSNPFDLTNMDKAVARIKAAMAKDEQILVFGDYDVDGVTSTSFLVNVLQRYGCHPTYIVPLRLQEGYGLSISALERGIKEKKPNLVIAVDCGTNSRDEIAFLRKQGIDVIIIDHHTCKEGIPEDCILVNPHVLDGEDKVWSDLCTVGLIFKVVHGFLKKQREEGDDLAQQIDIKDYLDLVALGTVADLVPLKGENRIFAKNGLRLLKETNRVGLGALFEIAGMTLGNEVTPFDISFRISPRINASGRLANAAAPIEMLLSNDWQECKEIAKKLDELNKERQEIERIIAEEAMQMVEEHYADDAALVLYSDKWHPGVVGIVASRVSSKYYRPTLVLGDESGIAKGSGRGIPGVNLVNALASCPDLMESWGGHPMAVGVAIKPERLDELRKSFNKAVLTAGDGNMQEPELEISCWLDPSELTEKLLDELDRMGPFGQGNPEPIFGLKAIRLKIPPTRFGNGHFRFQLETVPGQRRINGVAWKQGDSIPPSHVPVDLAVKLSWNLWNDQKLPQLTLVKWKHS